MSNDISGPATPANEHLGDNDVVIHIYTKFGDLYRVKYQARNRVITDRLGIMKQASKLIKNDYKRDRTLGL